jgi:tricarballylate dehydrogenase
MGRAEQFDVIVVGAGTAAFEAAVSAREHGAERVLMLEKAPPSESGGNAAFSHTGFRFTYDGPADVRPFIPHVPDETFARMELGTYGRAEFLQDLARMCGNRIDPSLADALVDDSFEAVDWMRRLGIRWEPDTYLEIDGRLHFEPGIPLQVAGGGKGQLAQWAAIADGMGIGIRHDTPVIGLVGGSVAAGVRTAGPEGERELLAPVVILCSGGFQASPEMRARYLGPGADLMKVRGSRHDTGEVLQMAIAMGAATTGHWQWAHASPVDATYPDVEMSNAANRYSYRHGITVNAAGRRFFDEGEAEHSYTYAKTGWAIIREGGGVAYQIFDQTGAALLRWQYVEHAEPVEADSIAELAAALGIDAGQLTETVDAFNAAVSDESAFDASKPDGRRTVGITPPKSNWATRIESAPFRAYPVTGGITFTFGGLRVDPDGRVLNGGGRVIEGLYATGDIVGLFYHNYPSCTGQTRNAVFGRRAGRHAAHALRSRAAGTAQETSASLA